MENTAMIWRLALLLLFIMPFAANASHSGSPPEALPGGRIISVDEAKAINDASGAFFIDVRNPINYGRGHLPPATSLPYEGSAASPGDKAGFIRGLPKAKDTPLVIYSHGPTGWKSYRAAQTAIEAGYKKVYWLRDGFGAWEASGYPVKYGAERN